MVDTTALIQGIDSQAKTPDRWRRNWQRIKDVLQRYTEGAFVPYAGATGDVDLGTRKLTAGNIVDSSLTASKPVFTDANKQLTSSGTLAIEQGGTGQTTAQLAINALSAVAAATNEHVLTKDTGTGNATFKAIPAVDLSGYVPYTGATGDVTLGHQLSASRMTITMTDGNVDAIGWSVQNSGISGEGEYGTNGLRWNMLANGRPILQAIRSYNGSVQDVLQIQGATSGLSLTFLAAQTIWANNKNISMRSADTGATIPVLKITTGSVVELGPNYAATVSTKVRTYPLNIFYGYLNDVTPGYLRFIRANPSGQTNIAEFDTDGHFSLLNDDQKLRLGAGKDSGLFFDGTDFVLDTAGDAQVNCSANKTLVLGEPVYKDINIGGPTLAGNPGQSPDRDEFVDSTGTDTGILTYALAVGEAVDGAFELQHDYEEGTDVQFHVHWQGIAAPTGTDKVQWELTYVVARGGTVMAAATVIVVESDFDTQYESVRSDFAAITGTNFLIGDQFLFHLERIAASADEYGGDALLQTVGVHHRVDTMGSRTINDK